MIREPWVDTSRHNGPIDAKAIKSRGFVGIIARCVIGQAERDPFYLDTKIKAEAEGLRFAAYGLPWPTNRDPYADAMNFVEKVCPSKAPAMPEFFVGDFELGTNPRHETYAISGQELVEQAVVWMHTVEQELKIEGAFYTAAWYWASSKLGPHIGKGEDNWPLIVAHYPLDPSQLLGVRYSKDVLDPAEISTRVKWRVPKPWSIEKGPNERGGVLGIQWTSKGRGKVDGYCASTFMDRDVLFREDSAPPTPPPAGGPADKIRREAAMLRAAAERLSEVAEEMG